MAQAQVTGQSTPVQPESRRVTLDEYLELLDDSGYEVIDGELIPMTPQGLSSSDVAHTLYDSLREFVVLGKLGRVRMEAAFALDVEPKSGWVKGSLVPDVAFVSTEKVREQKEKHSQENVFRVPPDLAVEVVSPTDGFSDMERKVKRYLSYGVPVVWLIDPQNRFVRVYSPDQPEGHTLAESETLTGAPVLPGWSMQLSDLFAEAS